MLKAVEGDSTSVLMGQAAAVDNLTRLEGEVHLVAWLFELLHGHINVKGMLSNLIGR